MHSLIRVRLTALTILACLVACLAIAQTQTPRTKPAPVRTPRIYVFDAGLLNVTDPKSFGFTKAELAETRLIVVSYLVVHPKGTLVFDAGVVPDAEFAGASGPITHQNTSVTRPLLPQMAAAGYTPGEITYFALSHYHGDHTANANAFARSTWIVQKAERDAMFDEKVPIISRENFSALKGAMTRILDNRDLDVFGDGTVVIKSAPGHTPGHQVLFVKLVKTGPVLLAGDLYHYPEERSTGRMPSFEFDSATTRVTRAKIEAFLRESGAQLWIEHDLPTHLKLPMAPKFLE
jgi:N-acyl homoserine lactone hydrolase